MLGGILAFHRKSEDQWSERWRAAKHIAGEKARPVGALPSIDTRDAPRRPA